MQLRTQIISKMLVVSRLASRKANASTGCYMTNERNCRSSGRGVNHTGLGLVGIMDLRAENAGES
jgi:hypothetical protein